MRFKTTPIIDRNTPDNYNIDQVTLAGLKQAIQKLERRKAAGPNEITMIICKTMNEGN